MNVLIKDNELLKKYNDISNKVSNGIERELYCKPVYSKKFLKSKLKCYSDETTNFNTGKIHEAGPNYICWLITLIDSVLKKMKTIFYKYF